MAALGVIVSARSIEPRSTLRSKVSVIAAGNSGTCWASGDGVDEITVSMAVASARCGPARPGPLAAWLDAALRRSCSLRSACRAGPTARGPAGLR
jgi:hypothetical protein